MTKSRQKGKGKTLLKAKPKIKPNSQREPKFAKPLERNQSTSSAVLVSSAKPRGSSHSNTPGPTHPRYTISITGCPHSVFPDLIDHNKRGRYARILASRGFMEEHPRQEREFQEGIVQMKPTWKLGTDGFNSYHDIERKEPTRLGKLPSYPTQYQGVHTHTFEDSADPQDREQYDTFPDGIFEDEQARVARSGIYQNMQALDQDQDQDHEAEEPEDLKMNAGSDEYDNTS